MRRVDALSCLRGSKALFNPSAPAKVLLCPSVPGTRACGFLQAQSHIKAYLYQGSMVLVGSCLGNTEADF